MATRKRTIKSSSRAGTLPRKEVRRAVKTVSDRRSGKWYKTDGKRK